MAKILITSGPTRQYIDPVRYLTNASSGRMGAALAAAAIEQGHEVVVVSGPVHVAYPAETSVIDVVTTDEMLQACQHLFPSCQGLIGAAAPCDYQPRRVSDHKIAKTGQPLTIELIETCDIVATLGQRKRPDQWVVGFALETEDARFRAMAKLQRKSCDLVVINGPQAIDASSNSVEMIDARGEVLAQFSADKSEVAKLILQEIDRRLIKAPSPYSSHP